VDHAASLFISSSTQPTYISCIIWITEVQDRADSPLQTMQSPQCGLPKVPQPKVPTLSVQRQHFHTIHKHGPIQLVGAHLQQEQEHINPHPFKHPVSLKLKQQHMKGEYKKGYQDEVTGDTLTWTDGVVPVDMDGARASLAAGEMVPREEMIEESQGEAGLPVRLVTGEGSHAYKEGFVKVNNDNDVPPTLAHTLAARCTLETGRPLGFNTEEESNTCNDGFEKVNIVKNDSPMLAQTLAVGCTPFHLLLISQL
jgi:hypothetical protein